jgi:hypothetical protein
LDEVILSWGEAGTVASEPNINRHQKLFRITKEEILSIIRIKNSASLQNGIISKCIIK